MSGVTDEGFVVETVDTIKTALEDELKTRFGASFNVRPTSVAGILIGVFAQKMADLWDAAEAIYGSQYPESAFGASLDQLALLTGQQRLVATRSIGVVGITGTPGTAIPALSRIRNEDTGTYWRTVEEDGTVTIPGASATTANVESEDFGEIIGVAGTLNVIDTVISGWDEVSNPLDASLGRDIETDAALRLRRANLLTVEGNATLDSIRAAVIALDGISEAHVFENVTNATDADGLPPHSFEVVLLQTDVEADDIAQAIWESKPAGISAYGSSVGTATDTQGEERIVGYSEGDEVEIYVSVTATTAASFSPTATGVSNIKAAIVEYGEDFLLGDDVIREAVRAQCFISGVTDVPSIYVDIYAAPTGTSNITVGRREVARFDTSRIVVTLV